jgi:hypothetical protein
MLAGMLRFLRIKLVPVIVAIGLVTATSGWCDAYAAASAEQMACCRDEAACPMHRPSEGRSAEDHSPDAAKDCCAISPPPQRGLPSLSTSAPLMFVTMPLWRGEAPAPHVNVCTIGSQSVNRQPAPTHVLLSVFLI